MKLVASGRSGKMELSLVETKDLMWELANRGSAAVVAVIHTVDQQDDEELFMIGGSQVGCLGLAAGMEARLKALQAKGFAEEATEED